MALGESPILSPWVRCMGLMAVLWFRTHAERREYVGGGGRMRDQGGRRSNFSGREEERQKERREVEVM